MLEPGEIDALIARDLLDRPTVPFWNGQTLAACALLYHRYIEPGSGARIPNGAFCTPFCDLPRWVFLEYLVQHCGVVLTGSNNPDLTQLAPTTPSHNVRGWNAPRLFAFSESLGPIFRAILDDRRFQTLGCQQRTTMVERQRRVGT